MDFLVNISSHFSCHPCCDDLCYIQFLSLLLFLKTYKHVDLLLMICSDLVFIHSLGKWFSAILLYVVSGCPNIAYCLLLLSPHPLICPHDGSQSLMVAAKDGDIAARQKDGRHFLDYCMDLGIFYKLLGALLIS